MPESEGSGNNGVGVVISSDLLSDVGIGRPTVGVGVSEIPNAVVIPTKMPVPVVGIGRRTSVEVSTTLGGTTLGGTPPVEPTEGVGSGVGRIGGRDRPKEIEGWMMVSGRPPVEAGGRIKGPRIEVDVGEGSLTGGADAVGVTTGSGIPPVEPTVEDPVGRAGPGMTMGVCDGCTIDEGRPPVDPTGGMTVSAGAETASLELGAGRSTAEVG